MSYSAYQPPAGHASSYYPPAQQQPSPEDYLSGAFPSVDRGTISAILSSTRGQVHPAYNALLAISSNGNDPAPPPYQTQSPSYNSSPALPPRPTSLSTHQPPSNYFQPPQSLPYSNHATTPSTPNYLTPTASAPNDTQPTSPYSHMQGGAITPNYPPASPNLHPTHSAPHTAASPGVTSLSQDVKNMSLHGGGSPNTRTPSHWASCDGCASDPIKGNRHSCVACPDYDLCDNCRNSGIHNHHRFEVVKIGHERHEHVRCDGCRVEGKILQGTRYICLKHNDEDWCERCIREGRACGGPYKELKQTEIGLQLEVDGCLPMPQSWIPCLGTPVATYNLQATPRAQTWLDRPERLSWYSVPARERMKKPVDPVFRIETKRSTGRMISDYKESWVLKDAAGTNLYTYLMESDRKTNAVKNEQFAQHNGRSFRPVWEKGAKTDSLNFQDPKTNIEYRWMSNRSISTLNDERLDFQRNALFERKSGKERIVADWTWWDEHDDPECCLTIRDPVIDHAMVIASLCILHDHHWKVMNEEHTRDPEGVTATQNKARLTNYGRIIYFHATDYKSEQQAMAANSGQNSSMSKQEKMKLAGNLGKIAGNVLSIANSAAAVSL